MAHEDRLIEVALKIDAPANRIFAILAAPHRHSDFDGSDMLRGSDSKQVVNEIGETFTMRMHRLGRDYAMINHIVEFEPNRRIAWEPAPGDVDTAGGDPSKIGVPSGYRWGFRLDPVDDGTTIVTEFFDCGHDDNKWILEREDGQWINGSNSILESMTATLNKLGKISLDNDG